jgi:DNA-binding NtrC family response regulator
MAQVLIVDDEARFRDLYCQVLEAAGFETRTAGSAEEALVAIKGEPPVMVVSDVRMPGADGISLLRLVRADHGDLPFLLVTAFADVRDAVKALKLGAVDYLAKPIDLDELVAAVQDALGIAAGPSPWEVPAEVLAGMVAESPAWRMVVRDAWRVSTSDATVLLTGESGTGKEVLTSLIHRASTRSQGPLVAVNCGAIPADLLSSELFGHEKGAFTGAAARRIGRFREADGGTLLLDEIGELPMDLQPALLRALETRRVSPVGSDRDHEVDYRLVAATNCDLETALNEGRFRQDLFYRLNVVAIEIPPLRQRPDDVLPLARHFLKQSGFADKRISPATGRLLTAHQWPGNVRELGNAMERAALMSRTEIILPEHLPPAVRAAKVAAVISDSEAVGDATRSEPESIPGQPVQTLAEKEIAHIRQVLEQTGGNRTRAAKLLGITRRGLIYKLKRLGL